MRKWLSISLQLITLRNCGEYSDLREGETITIMFLQHGDQVSTRGRGFMGIAEKELRFPRC